VKGILYKAFVAVVLMVFAGRWNWVAGWIYVAFFLLFDFATAVIVIPRSPELLIERSRRHEDIKSWDKIVMPLAAGLLPLISWIIAGFNQRWDWNPPLSPGWQLVGLLLTVGGHGIVAWAMGANAFFSPIMRIQEDRGHQVAKGGPYQLIRHPGYLGAIIFSLGIPLLLGSWWALIPGTMSALLYIVRTGLEDQTLQEELPGYREYAGQVIYRLIPRVW
jgi:protein-S-isoprenylcysteine O-methyltransferase Ste14